MMKILCEVLTPYKCKYCNQDMLFFTTKNNMLIDYKGCFVDRMMSSYELKNYLENKKVRYLKCVACGKISIIDWSQSYPIQLIDKNILKNFGACD